LAKDETRGSIGQRWLADIFYRRRRHAHPRQASGTIHEHFRDHGAHRLSSAKGRKLITKSPYARLYVRTTIIGVSPRHGRRKGAGRGGPLRPLPPCSCGARAGNRQGALCPRHPQRQHPAEGTVCPRQLRGPVREPSSKASSSGYVEGAFTGALKGGKKGLFEEANNGTIFLDEIGEISLSLQRKLLRCCRKRGDRAAFGSTMCPLPSTCGFINRHQRQPGGRK